MSIDKTHSLPEEVWAEIDSAEIPSTFRRNEVGGVYVAGMFAGDSLASSAKARKARGEDPDYYDILHGRAIVIDGKAEWV